MKTLILLSLLFSIALQIGFSQVKVNSAGNVGIGTVTPSYQLDIRSSSYNALRIDYSSTNDIIFDTYYSDSRLKPSVSHKGYIGYSSNFFRYGYFTYLYYYTTLAKYSDIKLKKNIKVLNNSFKFRMSYQAASRV